MPALICVKAMPAGGSVGYGVGEGVGCAMGVGIATLGGAGAAARVDWGVGSGIKGAGEDVAGKDSAGWGGGGWAQANRAAIAATAQRVAFLGEHSFRPPRTNMRQARCYGCDVNQVCSLRP